MSAAEKLEPDFYVTAQFGTTQMWLKRNDDENPEDWGWTCNRKRARRFGSEAFADAAASDFNKHASTAAVVEQE